VKPACCAGGPFRTQAENKETTVYNSLHLGNQAHLNPPPEHLHPLELTALRYLQYSCYFCYFCWEWTGHTERSFSGGTKFEPRFDVLAVDFAEADPYALEFVDAAEGHDAKVPEYDDYSRSAWHGNYTWTDQATPECGFSCLGIISTGPLSHNVT